MENNVDQSKKKDKFPTWVIVIIVLVALGFFTLPIVGIVAAITLPTLVNNTENARNKMLLKKSVSTLQQAMLISEVMNDKTYSNPNDVWNKAIKNQLNILKDQGNVTTLSDFTDMEFQKLSSICNKAPADVNVSEQTACAIIVIDVNGFDKAPNKLTRDSRDINDQFTLLLYSNKVKPAYNSIEYKIINNLDKY